MIANKGKEQEVRDGSNSCRICLASDQTGNMISPCRCSGTVKYVHHKCLSEWMVTRRTIKCNICLALYSGFPYEAKSKSAFHFILEEQGVAASLVTCVLTFAVIICCMFRAYFEAKHAFATRRDMFAKLSIPFAFALCCVLPVAWFGFIILELWSQFKEWKRDNYTVIVPPMTQQQR